MNRKLTYLIAPAGFGKTTLLSEWVSALSEMKWPVAWVSLDEGDNDPNRFWSYFVAALEQVQPEIRDFLSGVDRKEYINSDPSLTTILINAISMLEERFTLILDDYHVIDNDVIHDKLAYLIRYMPANMHLIISSRKEPPLSTVKLRAKNEVVELHNDDLKFTVVETHAFLSQILGFRCLCTVSAG